MLLSCGMGTIRSLIFVAFSLGDMALVRPGSAANDGGSVPQASHPEGSLHGRHSGGLGPA